MERQHRIFFHLIWFNIKKDAGPTPITDASCDNTFFQKRKYTSNYLK